MKKDLESPQKQIAAKEQYLKLLEEVRDYAIITMDVDGVIENWNSGAESIKGYRAEEIIGKNFRSFYTEEDLKDGRPERLLALARKEGRAQDEGWRVRKDGSRFWGSITITAIHDEEGNLWGYGKVTRDLTDKKAAEDARAEQAKILRAKNEELKRSETKFRHMIEEVQDYAIMLMDNDGTILNWNRGVGKIKGYEAEEIIGKSFRTFYTDEDRRGGRPERLLTTAREKGRAQDEGWRVRKDGSKFWGSITITAIHDDSGEVIGFSKVTRDLTERKAAEDAKEKYARELEVKNRELEQFAYIASHDLQEPLHTISSFVQLLEEEYKDELKGSGQDYIRFITEASQRMTQLVKGLLEYSRLGSNRNLTEVDCAELLRAIQADLSSQIKETKAEVEVGHLPRINGYETELRVLFQNLLSNALKFRKEDTTPKIKVSATQEEGHIKFAVSDNGIGIEPRHRNRVFRIFQRLHPRSRFKGTGIGLAHCRKIVELHGGKMWVMSEPGEGSTFYFSIPTASPASFKV